MLSDEVFDRFVKLAGMLGSEHEGERASAAKMASDLLREHDLTWRDVLAKPRPKTSAASKAGAQPPAYSQQDNPYAAWPGWTPEQRASMQAQAEMQQRYWQNQASAHNQQRNQR